MILQNWWYTTLLGLERPIERPLREDTTADVLIVGAGAAGLAAALRLAGSGQHVVVLERNICGGSSTGKSAGFLTPDSELELEELLRRFGPEGAWDLWEAPVKGSGVIVSAIRRHGIDCGLAEQDSVLLSKGRDGSETVREEAKARAALGYPYASYGEDEVPKVVGSRSYRAAIRYSGTYAINPLRFAQGVKTVLLDEGVRIYESSEATSIDGHTVHTHLGSVTAKEIIFCADKLTRAVSRLADRVFGVQTFLAVSEPLEDEDIDTMFPGGPVQCWDTDLIYTYFRLTADHRLLVGGGDLLTTYSGTDVTTPRVIEGVIRGLRECLPILRHVNFIQYWPGRVDTTRDLLPTVLRDERSPWIHYVLGCVGLPWAAFCGDFVARHVLDDAGCDDHRYYQYFRPDRRFLLPPWFDRIVGKRAVFAVNNAWSKYYQVDQGRRMREPGEW